MKVLKVVLVSNTCSAEEYKRVQSIKYAEKISPQQNYFSMLIDGFVDNNCEVICVSPRSIDPSNCFEAELPEKEEILSDRLRFIYPKVISKNPKRNYNNYIQVKKTIKNLNLDEDNVFIYDPLSFDSTLGFLAGSKKLKVEKMALVTDLPIFISAIEKNGNSHLSRLKGWIKQKIFLFTTGKASCFCFLTDTMNCINKPERPYVIVEGISSVNIKEESKFQEKRHIVMYAGGLYEKFGIKDLVDAVSEMQDDSFELHLYGEGNSVDYIKSASKKCSNIKYMGVVGVDEIKRAESDAYLLINPRPVDEEYTKYSFPSKTLEYMSSGTPVLTTKLSGIPEEYFDYMYSIQGCGKEGIKQSLIEVLKKSEEELHKKGKEAQHFVMSYKNSKSQARKILTLLGRRINED